MYPTNHASTGRTSLAHERLVVLAAGLLLLRLPVAGMSALWIDEAFSLYHARLPLSHLWGEGWQLESSPPLYYTVLWAWISLVADSELSARLLSLLLVAVSAMFVYRAGRILAGPTAGAAAVFVWLLPALGLEYSLEIRPYALQQLLIAIALWSFAGLSVNHVRPTVPAASSRQIMTWLVCLLFSTVASFYTHTTSLAFIGGLAAAGVYVGVASKAGWRYWRVVLIVVALVWILCLPQAIAALGVMTSNQAGLAWIPSSLEPRVVFLVVRQWALGMQWWSLKIAGPLSFLVLFVVLAAVWQQRKHTEQVAIGVVMTVVGVILLTVAGIVQSVLLPRTVLWLWLPFSIVVGCAASSVPWHNGVKWRVLAVAFVAVLAVTCVLYVLARPAERSWYKTIQLLEPKVRPGDRLLFLDAEIGCVVDRYAGMLAQIPRLQLDLGRQQMFRSGQRLNIVCNQMPTMGSAEVLPSGESADWVLIDGTQQHADVLNLLQRVNPAIKVIETIRSGGQTQALRLVRVNPGP